MDSINTRLMNSIESYCEINGLNKWDYINSLLKKAFMTDKYGERPPLYGVKPMEESTVPEEIGGNPSSVDYDIRIEFPKKKRQTARKLKNDIKPAEEALSKTGKEEKMAEPNDTEPVSDNTDKPKKRKLSVKKTTHN